MIDKGKVFAGVFDKIKDKIYELSGSESDGHKTPFGTDISKGNKPWSVEYELRGAETDPEEEFDFDMGDQTKEFTGENNGRMSDILSPREKAKQGMRARKKMNMATSKKLKSNMVFLCTLFTSCLGAMSSFAGEVIGEPMADVIRWPCFSANFHGFQGIVVQVQSTIRSALWENAHPGLAAVPATC